MMLLLCTDSLTWWWGIYEMCSVPTAYLPYASQDAQEIAPRRPV